MAQPSEPRVCPAQYSTVEGRRSPEKRVCDSAFVTCILNSIFIIIKLSEFRSLLTSHLCCLITSIYIRVVLPQPWTTLIWIREGDEALIEDEGNVRQVPATEDLFKVLAPLRKHTDSLFASNTSSHLGLDVPTRSHSCPVLAVPPSLSHTRRPRVIRASRWRPSVIYSVSTCNTACTF